MKRTTIAVASFLIIYSFSLTLAVAQEDGEESSADAIDAYGIAAELQNNKAFKPAAEEWQKFLKQYGKDPLAAKARHYLGICLLQQKKYGPAADAFRVVATKHPKIDVAEDAMLNLGWCEYTLAGESKGQKRTALYTNSVASFARLISAFPKGKYIDQALYFQAESLFQLDKRKPAIAVYQKLVKEHAKSPVRADGMYAMGVAQEELGDYVAAGKTYDQFIADYNSNELITEVRMRKAETVLQAGNFRQAAAQFETVAKVENFDAVDHALSRQAYCLSRLKDYAESAALYATIVQRFPRSAKRAEATVAAGRNYFRANQNDSATTWLERAISGGGTNAVEAVHWLCQIHLQSKQPKKALDLAGEYLEKLGDSSYAVHVKLDHADAQFALPNLRASSIDAFVAISKEHPKSTLAPQALYNAAFGAMELRKLDRGLELAGEFVKEFPKSDLLADVRSVSAECLLQKGEHDDAAQAFDKLVVDFPKHGQVETWKVRSALTLFLQEKYKDTVAALKPKLDGLLKKASRAEAFYLVGASYFQLGSFPDSALAFEQSLKADPQWRQADETLVYLSRAQHSQGETKQALETVSKCLKQFANSGVLDHAYYRSGEYHYALGQFKQAADDYGIVSKRFAKSTLVPFAIYGQGWSMLKQQQADEAETLFTSLLTSYANHQLANPSRLARGMARRQSKNYNGAVTDLTAFLKQDATKADRSSARYELGLSQVALMKHSDAVTTFTALLKDDKSFANADSVLYELAWAYKNSDKAKLATQAFGRLADDYPKSRLSADANFRLGEVAYEAKDYKGAIQRYTKAQVGKAAGELAENIVHKLAWSHFQEKQYVEAFVQFDQQVKQYGDGKLSNDARFMRAECLFKQDKFAEAEKEFATVAPLKFSSVQMNTLARLHGGQAAARQKKWKDVVSTISPIFTDAPNSPHAAEAHFEVGRAHQLQKDFKKAKEHFEKATTKSRGLVGAKSRFMLGELAFAEKAYDDAIGQFQRVMFGFGGKNSAQEIKSWQARSGMEAGRCAEIQISLEKNAVKKRQFIENAKTHYSFVIREHAQNSLAKQAKARLEMLNKL